MILACRQLSLRRILTLLLQQSTAFLLQEVETVRNFHKRDSYELSQPVSRMRLYIFSQTPARKMQLSQAMSSLRRKPSESNSIIHSSDPVHRSTLPIFKAQPQLAVRC